MYIKTILTTILCVGSPFIAAVQEPAVEQAILANDWILGEAKIAALREDFEAGKYTEFLTRADASWKKIVEDGQQGAFADLRKGDDERMQNWEEKLRQLKQEKSERLLALVDEKDDSLFARKIKSAARLLDMPQELSLYRQMLPGTGKNSDENALIDLDLEYEYKAIHLDMPLKTTMSSNERRDLQIALQMEKAARLKEISKTFQDAHLKKIVEKGLEQFDAKLAQRFDSMDLDALAKGRLSPANAKEEQVADTLSSWQGKFNDLFKASL